MKEYYGVILTDEVEDKVDALCEKIRTRIAKEKMTPRERYAAYTRGEKTDRMPVTTLAIGLHTAAFSQLMPPQLYDDPQIALLAYLAHLEYFQYDTVSMFRFSDGEEELGGVIGTADGSIPMLVKGAIESVADIEKFKFPNLYKDGTLPWNLWMYKVLKEKLGDIMPIFGFVPMPGGLSPIACSMEKLFMILKTNKPLAHCISAISAKFCHDWIKVMEEAGVDYIRMIGVSDVVSAAIQREFEFTYVSGAVNSTKIPLYTDGAGNWSHVLESYAQSGVAGFEVFSPNPIDKAKAIAEKYNRTLTVGVDSHLLLHGDKESIRKEVKRVVDACRADSLYYKMALMTDPLDYNTPNENVRTFVEAAKEFGQY